VPSLAFPCQPCCCSTRCTSTVLASSQIGKCGSLPPNMEQLPLKPVVVGSLALPFRPCSSSARCTSTFVAFPHAKVATVTGGPILAAPLLGDEFACFGTRDGMPHRTHADKRLWIAVVNLSFKFMIGSFRALTVAPLTCWLCVSLLFAARRGCLRSHCSSSSGRLAETLLTHAGYVGALQLVATSPQYLRQQEW